MADEISQAIQIIRLEFDGLRFGMNVTGATAKQVKNLTIFLYALLTREKLQGRTSLKKMISKDGNLQVFKIKETEQRRPDCRGSIPSGYEQHKYHTKHCLKI